MLSIDPTNDENFNPWNGADTSNPQLRIQRIEAQLEGKLRAEDAISDESRQTLTIAAELLSGLVNRAKNNGTLHARYGDITLFEDCVGLCLGKEIAPEFQRLERAQILQSIVFGIARHVSQDNITLREGLNLLLFEPGASGRCRDSTIQDFRSSAFEFALQYGELFSAQELHEIFLSSPPDLDAEHHSDAERSIIAAFMAGAELVSRI